MPPVAKGKVYTKVDCARPKWRLSYSMKLQPSNERTEVRMKKILPAVSAIACLTFSLVANPAQGTAAAVDYSKESKKSIDAEHNVQVTTQVGST